MTAPGNWPWCDPHATKIDKVRAVLALRKETCSPSCPGWIISESDRYGWGIERCDDCNAMLQRQHPGGVFLDDGDVGGLTDDDVAVLPEAQKALAETLALHDPCGARCVHRGGPVRWYAPGIYLHDNKTGYYAGTQMTHDAEVDGKVGED